MTEYKYMGHMHLNLDFVIGTKLLNSIKIFGNLLFMRYSEFEN